MPIPHTYPCPACTAPGGAFCAPGCDGRTSMACIVDNCPEPVLARGWCQPHYRRWWLYGDPNGKPAVGVDLTCKGCGKAFTARSIRARYCSDRCGGKARGRVPCARCNGPVWKTGGSRPEGQAICKPCRKANPAPYKSPVVVTPCEVCGNDFEQPRKGYRRRTCTQACASKLTLVRRYGTRACADCGTEIPLTCKRCDDCRDAVLREYYQGKNRRRRAVKRQADAEPYTLAEIAERDRFRCQLCRRKVNMQLRSPHPRSPSIDHVIPIVEGGGDVRANVQLAHRDCNTRKGARGSQQLALVG